ncbi:hypothetical protein U1Q18_009615 [Sarracenia purpurea var. burkii]
MLRRRLSSLPSTAAPRPALSLPPLSTAFDHCVVPHPPSRPLLRPLRTSPARCHHVRRHRPPLRRRHCSTAATHLHRPSITNRPRLHLLPQP